MSIFERKPGGFADRINNWMTPERAIAFQGIGQAFSQLGAGQPVNLSSAHNALMKRQQGAQMRETLQKSGILDRFTPDQQAILAQMEPSAAQKIILQTMFGGQQAQKGVAINGQLVNPVTGQVIGDYRTPEAPAQPDYQIVDGQVVDMNNPMAGAQDVPGLAQESQATGYIATGEQAAALGLNPANSYNVTVKGGVMKATQIGGAGTTVTVNSGSEVGTIPQGYELVTDPITNARSLRPIPGGPADTTKQEEIADEAVSRSGGIVTEDISRAIDIVSENPAWTTGFGAVLASVPGTQAKTLEGLLTTIRANVGFDRLQQMRDSSPTGGALGAINQTEMELLQNALGNLEQSQNATDLTRNLERLNGLYLEIIHGSAPARTDDPLGLFD